MESPKKEKVIFDSPLPPRSFPSTSKSKGFLSSYSCWPQFLFPASTLMGIAATGFTCWNLPRITEGLSHVCALLGRCFQKVSSSSSLSSLDYSTQQANHFTLKKWILFTTVSTTSYILFSLTFRFHHYYVDSRLGFLENLCGAILHLLMPLSQICSLEVKHPKDKAKLDQLRAFMAKLTPWNSVVKKYKLSVESFSVKDPFPDNANNISPGTSTSFVIVPSPSSSTHSLSTAASPATTASAVPVVFLRTEKAAALYQKEKKEAAAARTLVPLVIWLHGGGMCVGDAYDGTVELPLRTLHKEALCIASVDYRLAPEHPYPAAPNDCIAAVKYFYHCGAEQHGIDPRRMFIAGLSAGATLSAVAAEQAINRYHIPVRGFCSILPAVHIDHCAMSLSVMENGHISSLNFPTLMWFMRQYLPDKSRAKDPTCSPLYGDLRQMLGKAIKVKSPTSQHRSDIVCEPVKVLVVTATHDILRDQGLEFFWKLKDHEDSLKQQQQEQEETATRAPQCHHVSIHGTHCFGFSLDLAAGDAIGKWFLSLL